jgi:hypothetical protein
MLYCDIETLTGLSTKYLPTTFPVHVNSLAALTGCDARSGGLYCTVSMTAVVAQEFGETITEQYLRRIFRTDPSAAFVWRQGSVFATMPSSLTGWWQERTGRVAASKRRNAENLIHWERPTDCSSGSAL